MKQKFSFLLALLLSTGLIHSQVTIGSATPPVTGALLDLKDGTPDPTSIGLTAKKGLGLPRVELTKMKPTTPAELSASIGGTGTWNLTEHIGLLVYNAKKNGSICPGLHVWDGATWVALGGVEAKPDITMTDADGNVYAARWFPADPCDPAAVGAYWTTSNLYTTKDKDGAAFTGGARLNPGKYSTGNSAIIINSTGDFTGTVAYGQDVASISATNQTPSMKDYAVKFGLSYTHAQAMLACPTDWSLPDDAAWDALALAHGGANVAGAAMRANNDFYLANDQASSFKWGLSDASGTTLSGFNALPSGFVYTGGALANNFSYDTYWWSASTSGSYRYLSYNNSGLFAGTDGTGFYFSVRCVNN